MKKDKKPIITLSTRDCFDYEEMKTFISMIEELDVFMNTHENLYLHIADYGLWYGNANKAGIHLFHNAKSFFKRLTKDLYDIDMEIYTDKVIIRCYHHDGTNYHELIPASKLTKKELLEWGKKIFNEDQYKEMKEIKNKQGLINFLKYNLPSEYVYY